MCTKPTIKSFNEKEQSTIVLVSHVYTHFKMTCNVGWKILLISNNKQAATRNPSLNFKQAATLTNLLLFFEGTTSPLFSKLLNRSLARVQHPCSKRKASHKREKTLKIVINVTTTNLGKIQIRNATFNLRREPVISSDSKTWAGAGWNLKWQRPLIFLSASEVIAGIKQKQKHKKMTHCSDHAIISHSKPKQEVETFSRVIPIEIPSKSDVLENHFSQLAIQLLKLFIF